MAASRDELAPEVAETLADAHQAGNCSVSLHERHWTWMSSGAILVPNGCDNWLLLDRMNG